MTSAHTPTRQLDGSPSFQTARAALLVAAAVLCVGLLSAYTHLLQSQVKRGEAFREAQRAGVQVVGDGGSLRPAEAPGPQPGRLLASTSAR